MIRAGIFIGVDQTGNLQRLHDAAAGARRMHDWAIAQGLTDGALAHLITDEGGKKVRPDAIFDAVTALIDGPGIDQLIIYFAGHGVNINRSEHWLLTDAPRNPNAAVNVAGSVDLARYCGIRHVVLISDACRVAPEGIQAQNVRGMDIFPNEGGADKAKPVDQFFACVLGRTAAEIKDPAAAASGFSALYTEALLEALKGTHSDLLEPSGEADDTAVYIRPAKLQEYLEREVPLRVMQRGLAAKVNQDPDAILTVHKYWLARFDAPPSTPARRRLRRSVRRPAPEPIETVRTVTDGLVNSAISGPTALEDEVSRVRLSHAPLADSVTRTVEVVASPFGPDHFETQCGFKIRGARLVDFYCARAQAEVLGSDGNLLRVNDLPQGQAVTTLLRFENGTGTVIPALGGYLAALTFEDGELVDVSYEPSANTGTYQTYKQRIDEIRSLRAVAASASRHGRFRLDAEGGLAIAQRMQYEKSVDPTLAVYAAYAYHDLQAIERIDTMSHFLRDGIGATLFDVALLARQLIGREVTIADRVVPFVPLLGQGWALLSAHRVRLHATLDGIERSVKDSLWSLYDHNGCDKLQRAMETKEVL